jgi:3-deoxy-manno-octulosonate cytidylyltransferase (CMP-KDO synthetase)
LSKQELHLSKLQNFFSCNIYLSNENVTEIIEQTVLIKNKAAISLLNDFYHENLDNFNKLLYVSRAAIPGKKVGTVQGKAYRQICLYGYTARALKDFATFTRGSLEMSEDHELLRFLENGIDVGLVELSDVSIPVDVPSDLLLVEASMKDRSLYWRRY